MCERLMIRMEPGGKVSMMISFLRLLSPFGRQKASSTIRLMQLQDSLAAEGVDKHGN